MHRRPYTAGFFVCAVRDLVHVSRPKVSAGLIAGGFLYCQKNVESTSITCDNRQCQIMQLRDGTETLLTIPVSVCLARYVSPRVDWWGHGWLEPCSPMV